MGCSANPSASISPTGPLSPSANLLATPGTPNSPVVPGSAVFGSVSDLSGGNFTLTTLDGKTYDIVTTGATVVRYEGGTSDVGTSALADGEMVAVVAAPMDLPGQVMERALLIVINNSYANQQVMADE